MKNGEFPDLTGQQFGKIFVLNGKVKVGKALIKCECGIEKLVSRYDIFSGKVKSCGTKECVKRSQDLIGMKFSCLTVLGVAKESKNISGRCSQWECQCDCGNILIVPSNQLNSGKTKSCGCSKGSWISQKNSLPIKDVAHKQLFTSYKRNAKNRNLEWNLSKEEFSNFLEQDCFYCGSKPAGTITKKKITGTEIYYFNGVDRKNNNIGYHLDNCVACCKLCNHAKNDLSFADFLSLAYKIVGKLMIDSCKEEHLDCAQAGSDLKVLMKNANDCQQLKQSHLVVRFYSNNNLVASILETRFNLRMALSKQSNKKEIENLCKLQLIQNCNYIDIDNNVIILK